MNVIYIAHTKERIWRDAFFSILTLLQYSRQPDSTIKIWLFTDNVDYFNLPDVEIVKLTNEMLRDWYGEINFIHLQKIHAIRYVAEQTKSGDFLILDGDTYFKMDPYPLFNKVNSHCSFMHVSEGSISKLKTKSGKRLQKLALSNAVKDFNKDAEMYNAGTIGIARENLKLEDTVFKLSEELYRAEPNHIMEQLAHSIVLNKHTKIIEADEYIYHWWGRGLNVEKLLIQFFEENKGMEVEQLISKANEFKEEVGNASFNKKLSFWEKIIGVIK